MRHPLPLLLFGLLLLVSACTPLVVPAGAAVSEPDLTKDAIITADGARLPLRRWLPADRPSAVILALHGFNDYSNFFAETGAYFATLGFASYAYDQRGFGGAPNRGLWPGTDTLVSDVRQAVSVVRARHPGVPLFLLGESMGGAVVITAMARADPPAVDGVILAAPAVWGRASMPWYQNLALWVAAHTVPDGRLTGQGLGIRPSDNDEMLKALGRDPMVIKKTRIDAVFGLVGLMDTAMAAAARLEAPVLILYGKNDQLVPEGAITEMIRRLPSPSSRYRTVAVYDNGWHMLLRDLQADVVRRDVLAWILRPHAPLPSGADRVDAAKRPCLSKDVCAIVGFDQSLGTRSSAG